MVVAEVGDERAQVAEGVGRRLAEDAGVEPTVEAGMGVATEDARWPLLFARAASLNRAAVPLALMPSGLPDCRV